MQSDGKATNASQQSGTEKGQIEKLKQELAAKDKILTRHRLLLIEMQGNSNAVIPPYIRTIMDELLATPEVKKPDSLAKKPGGKASKAPTGPEM